MLAQAVTALSSSADLFGNLDVSSLFGLIKHRPLRSRRWAK
jgi:hypothetical protein